MEESMRIVLISQKGVFNSFDKKAIRELIGCLNGTFPGTFEQIFVACQAFPAANQAAEFFVNEINASDQFAVNGIHEIETTKRGSVASVMGMIESAPAQTTVIVLFINFGDIEYVPDFYTQIRWRKSSPHITTEKGQAVVLDDQTQTIVCFGVNQAP